MFRIDKRLVQVAGPAQIPLIPVPLPGGALEAAVGSIAEEVAAANVEAASMQGGAARAAADAEAQGNQLVQEARQKAEQLLRGADEEAAAKLREAKKQAEAIHADARQSGYQEGKQEALQAQSEQTHAAQEQLSRLFSEIAAAREALYHSFEDEIIDLALAIAGKIANTVIKQDANALEAMITHALKHMQKEGKITVRVSEEQYSTFFNTGSANFVLGDETISVAIESDPLLGEGDLLLESDGEAVNAGADSQLKYITLAFGRPWESAL